jgi:hypothetical protein
MIEEMAINDVHIVPSCRVLSMCVYNMYASIVNNSVRVFRFLSICVVNV